MENRLYRDYINRNAELWSVDKAIVQKINLILRENKLIGVNEDEDLKAIIEDHQALWDRYYEAMNWEKEFPSESPIEEIHEFHVKNIELRGLRLSNLLKRVDCFGEMFQKYNVPRLCDFRSLESCVDATRSLVRVWRDEAERRRGNGERSLIEWIRKLDHHHHHQHRRSDGDEDRTYNTFDEMRLAMIDLGNRISSHLCSYFMLISTVSVEREVIRRKIRAVEAVLGCLIVEENGSVVIERFRSLVKNVKIILYAEDCHDNDSDDGNIVVVSRFGGTESDLVRLILREVLRLEVGLSFPDLPMMLTDEIFLGMASYMREVFEKKLERVSSTMRNLRTELKIGDEDSDKPKLFEKMLYFGMRKIWNELDLKDRAD